MAIPDSTQPQPAQSQPPQQPQEQSQSTDELLRQLVKEQQESRAEVAELRARLQQPTAPFHPQPVNPATDEELQQQRLQEISQHPFYCPGCGALYDYRQRCTGKPEAGHPPIEVIPTEELLSGDPSKHTPAPTYS